MLTPILLSALCCLFAQANPADADKADSQAVQIDRWMELYTQTAGSYRMSLGGDHEDELTFEPRIILKYTNPVRRGQQHGAVYVWTHQGRPEVIGTIWSKTLGDGGQRRIAHEFQSLARRPVLAEQNETLIWRPVQPGVEWHSTPQADRPAESSAARLRQMRNMARSFDAWIMTKTGSTEEQLRLLPQPVFRYASPVAGVIDGGLFAYVLGTDPELILMLEAVNTDGGKTQWRYAAARMTTVPMQLRYQNQTLWECPLLEATTPQTTYFLNSQVTVRDSVIDE